MSAALPKPIRRGPRPPKRIAKRTRPRKFKKTSRGKLGRTVTLGKLKGRLWDAVARYVKDRDGSVCFTCGKEGMVGVNWHAGHFISRKKHSVIFHPDNVHSQCSYCNRHLKGNAAEYAYRFLQKYGREKFDRLLDLSRQIRPWKCAEIKELIVAMERGGADYECLYAERYS